MIPFLDLGAATAELQSEIEAAVLGVVRSGRYILGPEVEAFEGEYARYVGAAHAVGVGNGLDALVLGLQALGVGPGDEVIVPSNTYIATWLAITAVGAVVVPVEPDPDSWLIDVSQVERAITSRTRVLLPVHLYGHPCDMESIGQLAARHGLRVLDDAAQAHGATVGSRRVGAVADVTAWSFYPSKNLGALGDAGTVTTNDPALAERIRLLRNYGSRVKYENEVRGTNSRLDPIQAAVLRVKLAHLDEWNSRRAAQARRYTEGLAGISGLVLPVEPTWGASAWHVYAVRVSDRDRVQRALRDAGVETLVHYPIAAHLQPAYRDHGWKPGAFPVSEAIHREVLSLPLGPQLPLASVDVVIERLRKVLG